ncbi:MAG: alpha/beta hydrolase [Deltaproteobacteria bacterium]|nr:alpha/beta hydrolase [Deltaproteobacteria bacterium]
MDTQRLFDANRFSKSTLLFLICLSVLIMAVVAASAVQRDFGRVEVTNAHYKNYNGIAVRAKLLRPIEAAKDNPMPGVVYIHGYQNNRETGDAYCIELAKRGIVVLNIDAIGRGNSGIPNDPNEADFDKTYGGKTSLDYLRDLPFVNAASTGVMGHSLGAEMAYNIALNDTTLKALVITGFAYKKDASLEMPKNMLMIIGKYDEYRKRMTGTNDIEKEWMGTPETQQVFPVPDPKFGETYGDFAKGTARRVFIPHITHVQESHNSAAIAETLQWMRQALLPDEKYWIDAGSQTWQIKEWATLVAMFACFASLIPLSLMLIRTSIFTDIQRSASQNYACNGKPYFKMAALNGLLMWLYLPFIFVLFGIHVYVIHIDKAFPLMMVNGTIWWFLWINIIGFFIFRRWFKKKSQETGITLSEMGISFKEDRFSLDSVKVVKTISMAAILIAFAYLCEHLLESIFIVDFRFIFPFASDLTPYRALLCFIYFPFLLVGFLQLGILLHGQMRRPKKDTWFTTYISWSVSNVLVMIVPLLLFLMIQYVPLFTTGSIPLVGPGGMFVSFVLNLFHIIIVLIAIIPLSTWFYQLTGKIYLGALVNAALVTWMFVSSQVIAPIPI